MKVIPAVSNATRQVRTRIQNSWTATKRTARRLNPNWVLGGVGVLLIGLLVLSRFLQQPETTDTTPEPEARQVEVYNIGTGPRLTVQARVTKGNVIQIMAQAPGVVQRVNVKDGQSVKRGQTLVSLASNYQGGSAATVQRQIAGLQYQQTKDTYEQQKNLLNKQREVANQTEANAEQLRRISDQSLGETRDLIRLNENILDQITDNLEELQTNNTNGSQDDLILQTQQLQSQYQAGVNQLKSGLRQAEYQASGDQPPAQLAQLQKDITLEQLAVQEKSLDMGKEMAALQLRLAQVNEGTMYPGAPLASQVERVHVRPGQLVNPGTPLVTLQTTGQATTIVALVAQSVARTLSDLELAQIHLGQEVVELPPTHVSQEAVENGLYAVTFTLPEEKNSLVSDGQVLSVDLPIGMADTSETIPFIPLDAVYQNSDQAYVFVTQENRAQTRPIVLGSVFGSFVEVKEGLQKADQVILDRNVIDGDPILTINQQAANQSEK